MNKNTTETSKIRMLLASYYDRQLIGPLLEPLRPQVDVIDVNRNRNLTLEELLQFIPDVHAVIAADEPYSAEVLNRAEHLMIIARDGAGYDKVDLETATALGIVVTRAPVVIDATANLAIGLLIAMVRKIPSADSAIRHNKWTDRQLFLCPDLTGMTLGLAGFGLVGQKMAPRGKALGMEVIAYDNADVSSAAKAAGVRVVSLEELLATSDVVSVHLRHTPQTRHFFNAQTFSKMKRGAYFINTARGGIVKEADLVEAIQSGHLAGAGLDVFECEPVAMDNPLLALPNVVITPHVAGDTTTTMMTATKMNVEQILTLFSGGKPSQMLNPEVWSKARVHGFLKQGRP